MPLENALLSFVGTMLVGVIIAIIADKGFKK